MVSVRIFTPLILLACILAQNQPAAASGAYSCCFVDKDGKQYKSSGRASSFYKGSVERLCRTIALEKAVKQCNPAITDMAADLDFTKGAMPASYDLSTSCKKYPCTIGILVAGPEDVSDDKAHFELMVSNADLQCSIEQQINSSTDGWNLTIALPKLAGKTTKPGAACVVVRLKGGKEGGRTRFEFGPIKKQN